MRALLLALVLTVVTVAEAAEEPLTGTYTLETVWEIGESETLRLGPGAIVTGSGSLLVHGSLEALGTPEARVEISVPVILDGSGTSRLESTRVWGVSGTGVTLRDGNLSMARVTFEGNGVGLAVIAAGDSRVEGDQVILRAHASEGARFLGASNVTLSRAAVTENLRGIVMDLGDGTMANVRVNGSVFARNAEHVVVQLGSAPTPARVTLEENDFGATNAPGGTKRPSITVASDLVQDDGDPARHVTLTGNVIHEGDVGLRVEGAGFTLDSRGDTFRANRIGLSVTLSKVQVVGTLFDDTEQDIEGASTARLTTEGVTYGASATAVASSGGSPLFPWWTLLGIGGVLAAGAFAGLRMRRSAPHLPAEPDPPTAPPPDLSIPLRPMERRILEDVVAHPGSAQSAIAQRLGLTRQALHYHVKKLEARGLLTKTAQGRETRCHVPLTVTGALAALSSPPAVTHADGVEKE